VTGRSAHGPRAAAMAASASSGRALGAVGADAYVDWDEIYVDNVGRVYRTLYAKVGNRPDAEDLTTEVFLAAYRPLRIAASRGEVRSYLLATTRTVLASFWRTRLRVDVTSLIDDADVATFNAPADDTTKTHRVVQLLGGLPDRQRDVLRLRFLEAHSLRETASLMGTTIANVKVLQHRALRLAARLAKEEA
jgi:RNA polymerase sigma factor (sigma-70 family)